MALRLFLVGMVASLGLDVPTGWRVDSWERAGWCWFASGQEEWQELTETTPLVVDARVDEPPASARPLIVESADEAAGKVALRPAVIEVIDEPAPVEIPLPVSPQAPVAVVVAQEVVVAARRIADDAFSAIVEKMVVSFAAPIEEVSKTTLLAAQPLELPLDVFAPLPADEPTILAEAVQPAEAARLAEPPPAPDAAEWIGGTTNDAPDPPVGQDRTVAPKSATRNERLVTAVRLTRQALAAWAGVIDQEADMVAVQH